MAVRCSCVVDPYSVFCIVGWAGGSLVLLLSYSGQWNRKVQRSHQCRGSRYTLLGDLSWCDVGVRSAVHGVF